MHTPHFDELAQTSLVLTKNYVQQAVCSPTRTSLLTGRRPDRTRVFDLYSYFRTVAANYTTIPEFFRLHGYETIGMGCARARAHTHTHARSLRCSCAWAPHASPVPARFMPVAFRAAAASSLSQAPTDCSCRRKIFHPGHASGGARAGSDDACCSWSNASAYFHAPNLGTRAPRTLSPAVHVVLSFTSRSACSVSVSLSVSLSRALSLCLPFVIVPTGAWSGTDVASTHSDGKAWFSVPGPLEAKFPLPDNQTADHAVQTLRALAEKHVAGAKKPWFVAVGFHKVRVR